MRTEGTRLEGEELKKVIAEFQNEPDEEFARRLWQTIEQSIFGIRCAEQSIGNQLK